MVDYYKGENVRFSNLNELYLVLLRWQESEGRKRNNFFFYLFSLLTIKAIITPIRMINAAPA